MQKLNFTRISLNKKIIQNNNQLKNFFIYKIHFVDFVNMLKVIIFSARNFSCKLLKMQFMIFSVR